MDISSTGVLFIWIVFLWPLIVAGVYLLWQRRYIQHKKTFFFASTVIGYLAMILINFISFYFVKTFLNVEDIKNGNLNAETYVFWLSIVGVVILLMSSVFPTHLLLKKFRKYA